MEMDDFGAGRHQSRRRHVHRSKHNQTNGRRIVIAVAEGSRHSSLQRRRRRLRVDPIRRERHGAIHVRSGRLEHARGRRSKVGVGRDTVVGIDAERLVRFFRSELAAMALELLRRTQIRRHVPSRVIPHHGDTNSMVS